jgi:hypothetical protein
MSTPMTFQMLLSLSGCVVAALLWKYFWASRRPMNFPPGPPTLPFLGNLHQLPRSKAFLKSRNLLTCPFQSFNLTIL